MNVLNPSATPPTTRELKPLHPFLRLVALFLAVALTFTGPVPMALAATTASVAVTTSGSLNITNLAQSGTILTVVAGGSFDSGITLATGTLTGGTLSLTSLIFSGTSAFQNKDVNLSVLSNLQLAVGGSLTVSNGMSISNSPTSGILLGGSSAFINVGSSASATDSQGGMVGGPGFEIRVDNISASRSTLTVNAGTLTTDTISSTYLDLGARLDLVKNGRGLLGLNALNSPVNGGSLSVFSGTATVTAGTLVLGDNFLSDGTSNSLKITPSFPVVVALQGSAYVSSLLTSGGSASNVTLGVSTDAAAGQLVINNAATDASIFKGVLTDAVDGSDGFKMYVVKNGDGSLLLSGSSPFTGGLTLNAGTLIVNANSISTLNDDTGTTTISGPLGGGPLNLRGGTLKIQPPTVVVSTGSVDANDEPILDQFGNQIIVTTTQRDPLILLHNSVSFFNADDADVLAGGSVILGRKVTFASANGTDTLTLAGVMDLDSNANVTTGGSVTLVVNTPTEISGAITGDPSYGSLAGGSNSMSLVKSGSAQLTLSGGNQYLGDFTVAQGTLLLGSAGALGINDEIYGAFAMNSLTVSSGGVLDLGGFSPAASTLLLLSGTGAGSGALTNSGADASTYSGSLTLAAASSIGGAGDITLSGSVAVASPYNLTKLGADILTFGGTSTFSGSLLVSEGIAQIGSAGTLEFAATGGLVGNLTNEGVLRFNNSADRTVTGTISGTGSLVKVGAYNLTLPGATYTGATTISAGSLTVNGALSTSQITNSGTFNWSPTTSVFTGSLSGSGQTILTSSSAVTLTLGTLGYTPTFDGNIKIGKNVTLSISAGAKLPGSIGVLDGGKLTLATGAGNVFGSTTKLTIDAGGSVYLEGNIVSLGSLVMNGGSLTSSVAGGSISSGTISGGTTNITNVTLPGWVSPSTTVISSTILAGGTFKQMAGGSLGGTFSSGTYSQILLQPTGGASITLDGTVNAGTSVIASSGSGAFILQVQAPVLTPLFDIQSGVSATLLSGASLSTTGTLQVGGSVGLAGQSLAFGKVILAGGSLSGGTMASGSLETTSGSLAATSGSLGTTLGAGFGNITKIDTGILTISGSSSAYAGTLQLSAGTVRLGNPAALGSTGRVVFGTVSAGGAALPPVLQLAGNDLTLSTLSSITGSAIENGSSTAVTLTLTPSTANNFSGDLRNGGSGALSLVKSGSGNMTLSGSLTYTGATTVSNGPLLLSNTTLPNGSLNLSGGTLDLGGLTDTVSTLSLDGGLLRNGTLSATSFSVQSGSISAVLTGSGSLTKTGTDRVTLSGANTYNGGTNVNGGTLSLAVSGALSSGSVNVSAGELALGTTLQTVGAVALSGGSITGGTLTAASIAAQSGVVTTVLSGSGTFTKTGNGTVTLSGANVLSGLMDLQAGLVQLSGSGALTTGSLRVNGATLDLSASSRATGVLSLLSGSIGGGTLSATSFSVQSGSISAVLTGSGSLIKTGTDRVTLSGANTYAGGTNVNGGALSLAVSGALSSGSVNVSAGELALGTTAQTVGAVALSGGSITGGTLTAASIAAGTGTVTAVLSGSGTFTKTTGGTVTLSGANTLSGLMDLQAGLVQLTGSGSLTTGSLNISSGATLDLGGVNRGSGSLNLTGGSVTNGTLTATALNLQSGVVNSVLGGNATLSKTTTGLVTLNGVNTLSGSVQVSNGTLQLGDGQSLAAASLVQITGGSLTFGSTVTAATLKSLAGSLLLNNVSGGSVTLTLANAAATTESGSLSGTGSLVKSGSGNLTLSGVNSYTGSTTVNSGILTTGTGALGNSAIVVNSGGTLSAADFGLTASLTVSGSGSATVSNSGSYGAVINAGSVVFNGGTVAVTGLSGAGTTRFDGNATAGSISAGSVTVVGSLQANVSGGTVTAATLAAGTLSNGSVAVNGAASADAVNGGILTVGGSAALNLVAGGTVNLNGTTSTVGTLNGGSVAVASGGTLTVTSGGSSGVVSGSGSLVKAGSSLLALDSVSTGSVTVNAGTLSAVNYAQNSLLTVAGGQLVVSGSGLTLGTLSNGSIANFTANSGTITLGSLYGSGTTSFASNAAINSAINAGTVSASSGRLQLASLTGGSATASNLVIVGALNGGQATATSTGSLGALNGGSLNLTGAQLTVGVLSAGTVTLASSAKLTASSGTFTGLISGTGTLVKDPTSTTLTLSSVPVETIAVSVLGGSLTAGSLLTGSRAVSLATGANLNLTLTTSSYSGVVTATDKTAALNLSSTAPVTLSLSGSGAKLDGAITLANSGITLDFSNAGTSPFGSNASLIVSNGGTLALGTTDANRELDLNTVTLTGGSLTLSGTGKLLYDTKPAFLTDNNALIDGANVIIAGSITFDVLTQGTLLSSGTYQYFAGKVKPLSGADSFLTANRVLLDPKSATTTIRLAGGTFNDSIVAGGTSHQGTVSIEGLVYAGSLGIASGATTVLTDVGTLLVGTASAAATPITNNGSLQASSSSGIKTIANVIGGSGSFEKVGSGTLVLAGSSTYTGTTTLSNGLLSMSNSLALGNLGSVVFKGGTLQYGSGVTTDLSGRILGSASTSNFAIDTNGNNVAYGMALSGTVGLVKLGSGALTLNAANTFSGSVSISAGTLELAAAGTLAATNVDIASGSLLRFNRADAASFAGNFSGAGAIEKANTGALTLSGSGGSYTGVLSLGGGTLVLGNASALGGTLAFNGGVFQYGAGITTDISSRIAQLTGGSARIDTGTNSVTFAGSLSGTGGLVKSGAGSLTLASGSNDFSGATVVNAGSLTTVADALRKTTAIAVNGAVLNAVDFNSAATLAVDASGSAIVSGPGISTGTLTNSNSVSFTANTGKITLAGLSGTGTTNFGSNAKINGGGVTQGKVTVDGSLQSVMGGGTVSAATFASESVSAGSLTVTGSATIAAVSGGALTLNGAANAIDSLNGGNVAIVSGVLTVQGGSTAGVLSGGGSLVKEGSSTLSTSAGGLALTGGVTVNNGTLNAVDYASALMGVSASGRLSVSGGGLSLGTLSNAGVASFTASTGTITLASLSGAGLTQFTGNAILSGGVGSGSVTAGNRLQLASLTGGSVTASNLVIVGALNGGQATATSTGSLGSLTGGSLNLTGAQFAVGALSAGTVTLSNSATLTASSGTFTGSISGTGTLAKDTTSATLTLNSVPVETIAVSVLGGSLTAGNLLTGSRAVSVALGANLNLTLTTGSYSGSLTGLGTTLLGGTAGATLSLLSSASLDGALKLDGGNTLNLSYGDTNKFGSNATLTITNGGTLIVGNSSQELELGSLTVSSGSLFLSGNGGKILYDNKPLFLGSYGDTVTLSSGTTLSVGSSTVTIVGGSVTFDVLTQGTLLSGPVSGGSYQFTAGRVQLKGGTAIAASSLLLDPKLATSTIRMSAGSVSGAIVLGGTSHQGILSVEGTVTAGSLGVTSGTTAKFTQAGGLQISAGVATAITNSGSLQFSVTDGSKTVANLISGTGSLEKVDAGILVLSGSNTYSGNTILTAGILNIGNSLALGSGTISFKGGTLQYGSNVTTDLSSRISGGLSTSNFAIDTNGNNVAYGTGLSGMVGLVKFGSGKLTLNAANTFTGGVSIFAGSLELASTGTLAAANVSIASGSLLRFNRADAASFAGNLSGAGSVEKANEGALTLSGSDSGFTGTLNLSGGILVAGTSAALNNGTLVFAGGTLKYAAGVTTDVSPRVAGLSSGDAKVDTNGNDVSFVKGFTGTGGLTKLGAGSLILSGTGTFAGATTVSAGTLSATVSGALASTTGNLAVKSGATLSVVDYNSAAPLVVDVSGRAIVSGAGVSAGTVSNAGSVSFTSSQGLITVNSLVEAGVTDFQADAKILGSGITKGRVTVVGSLQSNVGGGTVSATTLASDSVSNGSLTVTGNASIGTVSGGTLTLNGAANAIAALNGGNVSQASGVLTVQGGSTAGVVSGSGSLVKDGSSTLSTAAGGLTLTGGITVNNGTLNAVDYASALMTVGASGRLAASGGGLSLGTLSNAGIANFTAATGTITLASLSGAGSTQFTANAILGSQLNNGVVTAVGRLELPTLSGASVTASNLVLGTLNSGQATATSTGTLGTLNGGSLNLAGAQYSVGALSAGAVTLSNSAKLTASSGTFTGSILGSGTLAKVGSATLTLGNVPAETIAVSVLGGSLSTGNLLTGNRAVSVASGANLNLTLATGSYSGILSGLGTTLLSGSAGATLSLLSSASLDGALKLDGGNTLNLSYGDTNKFGSNATLTITNGGSLIVGGSLQELELNSLNVGSGSLYLTGNGGKILYDTKPAFLTDQNQIIGGTSVVVSGSVSFDVLTQGTLLSGNVIGGTYQYTAGRVQLKGGTLLNASVLYLDPKLPTTILHLAGGTVSQSLVVGSGTHQGTVSVEGLVYAGSLGIDSGATVKLTQAGTLQISSANSNAPNISNNGTLQVFVAGNDSKTLAGVISGSGSLEKLDSGVLVLSGANTYSGRTSLSGGTLVLNNAQALGTGSSPLVFNGGAIRYGSSVSTDISSKMSFAGTVAVVDTNGNNVNFSAGLNGGGLTKLGNGILVLAGGGSFKSTGLDIAAGTVDSSGILVGDTLVEANAKLRFTRSASLAYDGVLSGSGTLEQAGAGELTLTGNNSNFMGSTVLSNGLLSVGTTTALGTSGSLIFNGGTLRYAASNISDLSSRIGSIASGKSVIIDTNNNNVGFASALTGAGGFTKLGDGSLTFTATNTYTGATTVKAGTLVYSGVSSGSASVVQLSGGAVAYDFLTGGTLTGSVATGNGTTVYLNNSGQNTGTFNGVISGTGDLMKVGSGAVILSNSQVNSGSLVVSAGTLTLGTVSKVSLASKTISIATGATLDASNLESLNPKTSLLVGGSSTLNLGYGTINVDTLTISEGALLNSGPEGASIKAVKIIDLRSATAVAASKVSVGSISLSADGRIVVTSGTYKGSMQGGEFSSFNPTTVDNLKITGDMAVSGGFNVPTVTGTLNLVAGKTLAADSVNIQSGTLKLSGSISASSSEGVVLGSANGGGSVQVTLDAGATVTAKAVTINSGSVTMRGAIDAGTTGNVNLGSSNGAAVSGSLSGSSASITASKLGLNGGSTLTLDKDAGSALAKVKTLEIGGSVNSRGTLIIDAGTTFAVQAGNTIKGSGEIVGKVTMAAGAIISPGNSPGILGVGTLTVPSGATLVLERGKTASDYVTGTSVDLQPGSVIEIVDYDRSLLSGGSYAPFAPGLVVTSGSLTTVNIKVRVGTITGTVGDDGVAYPVAFTLAYTGVLNGRTIEITHQSLGDLGLASGGIISGNNATVGRAVDARMLAIAAAAAPGDIAFSALDEIGIGVTKAAALANLPAQLAAVNPAAYAELAGLSNQRTLMLNQGIVDHLRSLRAGLIDIQDQSLSAWTSTYGTWQRQNGNSAMGTAGYSGSTWGSILGVEQRRGDLTFGFTGAMGQTSANFKELPGGLTTDAWHGGLYAVARMGNVVLESSAVIGASDTKAHRTISAPGLTTREGRISAKGMEWLLNTGAALPLVVPGSLTITPSARLMVQGQTLDPTSENNLSGLEVALARQSTTSVLHQAGVELRKQMSLVGKSAAATLQTDWIHNYNSKGRDLNMAMGGGATSFGYKGSDSGADALRLTGAVEAALNERTTLRLSVDYQTMTRATSTNGSVSLGYTF